MWVVVGAWARAAAADAAISIIIDDMGNNRVEGLRVLELPGPVTCSFLPHTPFTPSLAELAWQLGKDVMVHLPMESDSGAPLGPGGLKLRMRRAEFVRVTNASIDAVPHASGVSNHMGSRLTREAAPMRWLAEVLEARRDRPFFVDSRTTEDTVAAAIAHGAGLAVTGRDIFLDNDLDERAIRRRFDELLARARRHGTALGIGHPHPETVAVLQRALSALPADLRLVSTRELIRRRRGAAPARPAPRTRAADAGSGYLIRGAAAE